MAKRPARTWTLVLSLGLPLVVVGGAAMVITFATLIDVARINGLPFPEMFPIVVDVGMVGTMITAAQLRLRGVDGRWLAYLAFIVLSLVSVVANGTHALHAADMTLTTPWAASLIGAVPSATLLVITHLVMKLIPDEKERMKLQQAREKHHLTETSKAVQGVTSHKPHPGDSSHAAMDEHPASGTREPSPTLTLVPTGAPQAGAVNFEEVQEQVLAHIAATGDKPTGKLVGEWLGGKSAKTGQRLLSKMTDNGLIETERQAVGGLP